MFPVGCGFAAVGVAFVTVVPLIGARVCCGTTTGTIDCSGTIESDNFRCFVFTMSSCLGEIPTVSVDNAEISCLQKSVHTPWAYHSNVKFLIFEKKINLLYIIQETLLNWTQIGYCCRCSCSCWLEINDLRIHTVRCVWIYHLILNDVWCILCSSCGNNFLIEKNWFDNGNTVFFGCCYINI